MAEDEQIQKVQPEALKKGGYCFIRGMPCRIAELEHLPKATANGNKRLRLRGPHAFTGKVYDTLNLTAGFHGIDAPVTTKSTYSLLDCDADTGFLSLLTEGGDCKEDVSLVKNAEDGKFDEMGAEVLKRFDQGEALKLTVLSLLGKDVVVACETDVIA